MGNKHTSTGLSSDEEPPNLANSQEQFAMLAQLLGSATVEEAHQKGRAKLEEASERLRGAIVNAHPKTLASFLWAQLFRQAIKTRTQEASAPTATPDAVRAPVVLAMEYLHAVLSSHAIDQMGDARDDTAMQEVLNCAAALHEVSLGYVLTAAAALPGELDYEARTLAMHAMSSWALLRGHRYQQLEEEFFAFVLAPHDDALLHVYGIHSAELARGLQAAVDATRFGQMRAAELIRTEWQQTMEQTPRSAADIRTLIERKYADEGSRARMQQAVEDLFSACICDVGKSSGLPTALLDDLSFTQGEEREFFAEGPLRGTPMRRLPARQRPLVRLDDSYFAFDPNFLRDSAYRAIQWGLETRLKGYAKTWGERQAEVTEAAFPALLATQLAGAIVLRSIFYRDPDTNQWVENDLIIVLGDALLQIEVKAGVMPMHSPEIHFDRHVRTVQSLVVKAKQQSERFFRYAAAADEVELFERKDGAYVAIHRLRLSSYRVIVPIGLTVEAFTPFSSMSKRLPEMTPILGKYPFISMSVDDLFVLSRFLPTAGELFHYLSVRQRIAGQPNVSLIDELDHLGGYVNKNRMDMVNEDHFSEGADMITHAGASDVVDSYFSDPDWASKHTPRQPFPALVQQLLTSIDENRGPRFLHADATIRDFASEGRNRLALLLGKFIPSLSEHDFRWAVLGDNDATLFWVQRAGYVDVRGEMVGKAEAIALTLETMFCTALVVYVGAHGQLEGAWAKEIWAPAQDSPRYVRRREEGRSMLDRAVRPVSAPKRYPVPFRRVRL